MNILFIVQHFPCLSETFILNQITGLIDAGHQVRIYALGKPDSSVIHEDVNTYGLMKSVYTPLVEIPASKWKKLGLLLRYFPQLFAKYGLRSFSVFNVRDYGECALNLNLFFSTLRFLNWNWKPDVTVTHFGCLGLYPACWKQMKALDVPFVTFFHAHEISPYTHKEVNKMYHIYFKQNDLLLPISRFWKKKLEASGAEPSRVLVHRMGVDLKRFEYVKAKGVSGEMKIVSVGRLTGQKGYEYALKGVAEFCKNTSIRVEYTIIGTGVLENELKQLAGQLGIADIVRFLGPQAQTVVKSKLRESDLFLLPSVCDEYGMMEGIPVAIMESMAMGIPVISTYHSGIPELIEDGVSGLLCKEKKPEDITRHLFRLASDPKLSETISYHARKKIEEEYDIGKLNDRLIEILKDEIRG